MKRNFLFLSALAAAALSLSPLAHAQFTGFGNGGLVGVGRVSGDAFDALGPNIDSLGGIGSSLFVDQGSLLRSGDVVSGYTYSGTLYGVPDRGFNGATLDYHPRVHTFSFAITPYYGSVPTNQTQIALNNTATTPFTYDGTNFTGFEANDTNATVWPQSPTNGLGQGHRSLDPEGLARAADGTFYIGDEYGPAILHFDASGALLGRLTVPEAFIPKRGNYPGANVFGTNAIVSGRIRNRGFEGLTLTPDGRRLVAALQSPLQQDGSANVLGRNTRLLFYDVEAGSPTHGRMVAEYVYQLTLNGNATTNRQTLVSEIVALNSEQFLVMERDSLGLGDNGIAVPNYKAVVAVSTRGATNIANTGYDLERGAPGAVSLPTNAVLSGIAPVARLDLVQVITTNELARFSLNLNTNKDANTLSEKWEGLGLVPLGDLAAPDDFLLLLANDNDFVATNIYQNGVFVGTNALTIDNMFLAYRVTLPGYGAAAPANTAPGVTLLGPTNATLSAPAAFTLTAACYDQDGIIINVEFFEGAVKIGEDATFPFQLALAGVTPGTYSYTAVVSDNSGATATSAPRVVVVTPDNFPPNVTLLTPTNNFTANQPVNIVFTASASDPDGSITKVEYYRGATRLGQATAVPYSFTASNFVVGTSLVHALAYDNQSVTTASAAATVTVRDVTAPIIVCSSNLLLSCTNSTGTVATFVVTATDNNDPGVTVVCTPPSGSVFLPGTNTVNCTATDAAGNSNSCSFKVIVLPSLVTIERAVIVRWNCGEMLQGADNVNGPWLDIPAATSPYVVPSSEARRFYRVRN